MIRCEYFTAINTQIATLYSDYTNFHCYVLRCYYVTTSCQRSAREQI